MKETLVLIPGMDGTSILFEQFLDCAPDSIDVIAIALPDSASFTYPQYAKYVAAKIGDKPVTLVAESFAGMIAYELIKMNSCNIKRVIFAASFLSRPSFISRLSVVFQGYYHWRY